MKKRLKEYRLFIIFAAVNGFLLLVWPRVGIEASRNMVFNILDMLKVLPPIFLLIGLFDVWVPREKLMALMGKGSGIKGPLLAFALGSFTAGPLYAAFPVAVILMKKGAKYANVLIFVGAWSSTKLPLILFETSSLGPQITWIRFIVNTLGILAIALTTEYLVKPKDQEALYQRHLRAS